MKRLISLVTVLVAWSATPALAASSSGDGYGGSGNQIVTVHHGLPFTGLDVALLAVGGLLLLGLGVVIRRVSRSVA